ncbi:hypothetical protein BUALT_Bualt06G0101800 [Buddleja alternifolia]|uniref:Leucine-rich repeat-containing N-terminal plant-type domain-containing protein n=1 Tax=Buddleja alternifolia TaxID=168488 RepID=A0AAV6XE25_9LAMI|nr:hypothetical protein BUALT_Bualt06G0101800 [Buddleja alternifolia]
MILKMITRTKLIQLLPLFLVLFYEHCPLAESANTIRCIEGERQALLNFKDGLIDTNARLSSWGEEETKTDCCKWRGVHCHNKTNHVTRLDLRGPETYYHPILPLKGTISTSLLQLNHLTYLDLSANNFGSAPIPEFISSFSRLKYLNLSLSNFSGLVPHNLGNLSNLLYIDLRRNYGCYSRSLDWVSNLHSLEYLDLGNTNLSMSTNWLQAVTKLTNLKELHLKNAEFPGIPSYMLPKINGSNSLKVLDLSWNSFPTSPLTLISWFSNFSSSFTSINLRGVNMSGPVPDVFEKMISLEHLDLGVAELEGGIPKYLGNMSSLMYLDLRQNNLAGEFFELMMNLSGPIEKKLQYLDLSRNSISGSISNISRFSFLKELKLIRNKLNGSIQEDYLKFPYLIALYLASNQFTGSVPDFSVCPSLKELVLDQNMFSGNLAESIGGLSKLEILWIGSNLLEGIFTEVHMSNLYRLRVLDLSNNPFLTVKVNPNWVNPFHLEYLNLRNCKLGPHFPLWLKTQRELVYIDISSAGISDIIPSWFGRVSPKLLYLNTSNNQMNGVFPKISFSKMGSRGSSLPTYIYLFSGTILDLSRNNISGLINFLCQIRNWELIDLSDNMLSGPIPNCFTNFERLKYLNLANNRFSGEIPYLFGNLSALSLLHLRNNSFSGGLPISMRNCRNLRMIDLGENRFTGELPTWMDDSFSMLIVLILRSNQLYGSIPSNLCGLANIQILDLSSNKIIGAIPECVRNYIAMTEMKNNNELSENQSMVGFPVMDSVYSVHTKSFESAYFMWKGKEVKYINHLGLVKVIDLSCNNLAGEIPSDITKLVGLVGLNISENNLTGVIPRDIGEMKPLNFLDFSRNHLSGGIPTSLSDLSHLGVLNLSYNNLSGRIPQSNHALTFDESSYIENYGLCGKPLNKSCPADESHGDPSSTVDVDYALKEGESEDEELITEGFYIAMALGFIVGFWGIFGTILLNKAWTCVVLKVANTLADFLYVR